MQIRSKILLDIGITCKSCFGYLPSCHVYLFSSISLLGNMTNAVDSVIVVGGSYPMFNDANYRLFIFQKWPMCMARSSKNLQDELTCS